MNYKLLNALAAILALVSTPASACSFTWKKGWSPDEIKERSDVRKVKGTYRLVEVAGERFTDDDGEEWVRDASYHGRLNTLRGTGWDTYHEPRLQELTCIYYFKPEADAKGTFWISRKKVDGRYRILLWEGEYLPASDPANARESDAQ